MNSTATQHQDPGGPWDVGMERIPLVSFDGDLITIKNYRNFRYETDGTHQENYETRTISISALVCADFIVVPFATQPDLAHTMMSFGFDDGQHLVVSVEARRRLNHERDAIGQRTEIRSDDVYLYRSRATPEEVQTFFQCVMSRVDKLSKSPETYNTIWNNCLTNIRDHINRIWPKRVPWNCYLAYKIGLLQSDESFESTHEHANITAKAKGNWHREDFSALIRS